MITKFVQAVQLLLHEQQNPYTFNRLSIQIGISLTFFDPFLTAIGKKWRHGYFMQDGSTANNAKYSFHLRFKSTV
jgi:hypothetical protein